ncbi:hypothetical protein TNCV_4026551 [Trichonephila clavipes]|nr:hypothetical protein TNCV_4026551 [Trichonephila clavipes]
MFDPSPFVNPTPLAHADTSRDVLPRGGTSQTLRHSKMPRKKKLSLQEALHSLQNLLSESSDSLTDDS